MTDFARFQLELMARARDAIEPKSADRERLHQQLASKIALLSTAAVASSLAVESARPWRHLLNSHLTALSAVAAVTAATAFGTGYFTGHRTRAVVVKTVTVTNTKPTSTNASPLAQASNHLDPASLPSSSDWGHSGTRPRVTVNAAPSANAPENSLSEELDLLRRAERTIRNGNSLVALGLLRDLDEKFPKGQLLEERTAARVMANCQMADADEARSRGSAYLLAHPQSVYADRVRTLCQLDGAKSAKDSPAGGN